MPYIWGMANNKSPVSKSGNGLGKKSTGFTGNFGKGKGGGMSKASPAKGCK